MLLGGCAGATCSVMPSSVAWAMRHTPCVKCSCLLYLAAVRPPASDQGHTHNGSLCCLRCAKAEADRNDLCEGMLVMCHPGLEAAEKVAQTWQR